MAAPALVQAGTGQVWQSGAAVAMTLSGATVGNIVIVHIMQDGIGIGGLSLSSISGLAALDGTASSTTAITPIGNVGASPVYAARNIQRIGRATDASVSVSMSQADGNDLYARLYEFSGVASGSTLSDVIENGTAGNHEEETDTSATINDVAVVTLGSDRLALNFIGVNDDNQASFDTVAFTGMTGGTWVSGGSYGSSTGTDGSIGLQYATMASAGTIDGGTLTMASDPWGVVGFALIGTTSDTPVPRHPAINHQNPGLLMENVKRNWNRLRSGLLLPDREIWTPPVVTA